MGGGLFKRWYGLDTMRVVFVPQIMHVSQHHLFWSLPVALGTCGVPAHSNQTPFCLPANSLPFSYHIELV
jgi:hypothetical protein